MVLRQLDPRRTPLRLVCPHDGGKRFVHCRSWKRSPKVRKLPTIKIPGPRIPRRSVIDIPEPHKPRRRSVKRKKGQSQIDFISRILAGEQKEEIAPGPPETNRASERSQELRFEGSCQKPSAFSKANSKSERCPHAHPDLVPLAAELARGLPDPESRSACISLLTNITPDGPVPEWLTTALGDPHPWVQGGCAICRLLLQGPRACRADRPNTFGHRGHSTGAVRRHCAWRRSPTCAPFPRAGCAPRAHASVRGSCFSGGSTAGRWEHHYVNIALALTKYGPAAVTRLTPLLRHTDRNRRVAAIVALRSIGDPASPRCRRRTQVRCRPGRPSTGRKRAIGSGGEGVPKQVGPAEESEAAHSLTLALRPGLVLITAAGCCCCCSLCCCCCSSNCRICSRPTVPQPGGKWGICSACIRSGGELRGGMAPSSCVFTDHRHLFLRSPAEGAAVGGRRRGSGGRRPA